MDSTGLFSLWKQEWRSSGLMVSALVHGSNGPGSSPGRGHCVVFLGNTHYSHSASLHPGIEMDTMLRVTLRYMN